MAETITTRCPQAKDRDSKPPVHFTSLFMPYVLPKVTVVAEGEEEAEDPDNFEPKWPKGEGEPPAIIKDFRKYIRHAAFHFDKAALVKFLYTASV